jgi:Fur family transcriptional regulator, peroxide stress response regulator
MWRKTPQTLLIRKLLEERGHATNQDLAAEARKIFPQITNTTIHRITTRLVSAGMAAYAPSLHDVKVIDANIKPHDHFICQGCGRTVDINLSDEAFNSLQKQLPGKLSRRGVLVAGTCEPCLNNKS